MVFMIALLLIIADLKTENFYNPRRINGFEGECFPTWKSKCIELGIYGCLMLS